MSSIGLVGVARAAPPAQPPDPGEPQDTTDIVEVSLESLLDLDVGVATRRPISIAEAPGTTSVIIDDQLRDYRWHSFDDVLYQLPGFARSQDYERRTVSARGQFEGWNNNRLLLLIDGMPHNDIETGAAWTWDATPLFFVQKVEVLRGPASAMYGSNAMNGVVSVTTVSADDLGDGGLRTRASLGLHEQSLDVVGAHRFAGASAVVGFNANRRNDPYLDHDGSGRTDADGNLQRFEVHDHTAASYLWLKLEPTGALDDLTVQVHQQDADTTTGHGWNFWIPDADDYVRDSRTLVDVSYQRRFGRLTIEEDLQYQRQAYELSARMYPVDGLEGYYPDGVTERIETALHQVFGRSLAMVDGPRQANLLAGVEYAGTLYRGDHEHDANVIVDDPDQPPVPGFRPLGPIYEPILDRPVSRLGLLAQATSGTWLGARAQATAGLRFDDLFFSYRDLATGQDRRSSYRALSPRLGLVVTPVDALAIKLLGGHSYRTPTPVELFSSHTLTAGSNIATLDAEESDSYEVAVDWAPAERLRWRSNVYLSTLRNQIDYTVTDLRNRLSDRRWGLESEVIAEHQLRCYRLDGYASYSMTRLISEQIQDPDLSPASTLVWFPAHLIKLGARATSPRWGASVEGYYQSRTRRRASDRATPAFADLRSHDVPGFATLGATAWWNVGQGARVGLDGKNLLGSRGRMIATDDVGFDYRIAEREVMLNLDLDW